MSKLKKLLIASLSVVLAGAIAVPVTSAIVKASNTPVWSDAEFDSEYVIDQKVNIPERTLSVGGENCPVSITLTYPDGSKSSIKSGDFIPTMAGEYVVTYSTSRANGGHSETKEFFVADKLWSVKNEKSSIEYGTVGQTDALLVRLAKGDTLTFNKIIDLADYDKTEDTLFEAFINPDAVGSNDFSEFIVKFTDAYDPEQVLTVHGNKSTGSGHQNCLTYFTAAGANQSLGGLEGQKWHVNNIYGTPCYVSFCSQSGKYQTGGTYELTDVTADVEKFSVLFDQEIKELYIKDRVRAQLVADFDNPLYYPSEPLWNGFTSGKVIVSVMAESYAAETANFAVSQLLGYDLSAENRFVETDAPEISVDVDEKYVTYNDEGTGYFKPLAIVGGHYPVPTATAFDGYSGDVKVETKVYSNYTDISSASPVAIAKDRTFAVESVGTYAIVYTAKDNMGNTAQRVYWITAVDSIADPLQLSIDTTGVIKSDVCGVRIPLAPYTATGGSGDVNVTITATCGDTVLDVSNGVLIAEKAGTWTIDYLAKDYSGITMEKSYEIEIDWGTEPVFLDTPMLPRYFISGMEYVVPTVHAYDYSTGTKVEKTASLVVTDANGTETYEAGEAYIPVVDEDNGLEMSFKCEGVTIPLKDVQAVNPLGEVEGVMALKIENMFLGEGFEKVANKDGLILTATSSEDFGWLFANSIAAEGASVKVKGVKGYSSFSAFEVTLEDYANSSIAVTMRIEQSLSGTASIKFGNTDRKLTKGLNMGTDDKGNALDEFMFSYQYGQFYVDNIAVAVDKDDNGNAFNGFPSGKVYISAKAVGVREGQQYIVKQLDNHIVKNNIYDTTAPKIAISGTYGGLYNINAEYVVTPAIASDVIDPNVECTVTVKTPSGAIAKDLTDTPLQNVPADAQYTIKLTEYGQYQVTYNAKDWANKRGEQKYAVNVFDRKAPKATIVGEWSETAKVGDTVILPEVEISDDFSEIGNIKVYRTVRNPFDVLTVIGYDSALTQYSFTFKHVGDYKFVIIVYDEAGNQTLLDYVVTVTKGE